MNQAIFVGLSTIDIVYRVDAFPAANTKVAASSQSVFAGGPATNAAIACAHLGCHAALVSAVGRHPLAGLIRQELDRHAVRLIDLNPDFDDVPVLSSVSVDRSGNRNVVSANALRFPAPSLPVDRDLCRQAGILLVDGHSMPACRQWAAAAQALGIPVVLDAGSWKNGTEELLKCVDVAICSADFRPPGCGNADDVLRCLGNYGIRKIAISGGSAPISVLEDRRLVSLPVPQVHVVDTMGAGDVLHGAYCWFALQGLGFVDAVAKAAAIASESCRHAGTRAWMRDQPAGSQARGAAG